MTAESRTVDVHQHLLPPLFVEALRQRKSPPRIIGAELEIAEGRFAFDPVEHELEARIASLDRQGTDVGVLSLQQTLGHDLLGSSERVELVAAWEAGIAEVVAAASGRFVALAAGPMKPGFVGSSVGSDALEAPEALETTVASVRRYGGFVLVHPSGGPVPPDVPGWWGALSVYTAQMQAAYLRWLARGQELWPDVSIVFSILAGGGPFQLERLGSRGIDVRSVLYRNVFFDTASYGRRALELCVETFGVEQIVYGSDLPVVDPEPTLRAVKGFGESVERLIRCDNPNRLLA
jgi:predicted TIM-barrel fold metal-dependent hydrolase